MFYVAKFKDGRKDPPVAQGYFPDADQADAYARRIDQAGYSVYSCISRLSRRPRNKKNVAELDKVVVDNDLRAMVETREQVLACLRGLLLPPSWIDESGGGLHPGWDLKEPLTDGAGLAEAEAAMKRLAWLLAADPVPTHCAALLRHRGTHNYKYGEPIECRVIERTGKTYDISEFADMFDLYGDAQLLHYKEEGAGGRPGGNGSDGERKPPIDVAARFAAMGLEKGGENSIHPTQLSCSASLLRNGVTVGWTVQEVLEATQAAVTDEPRAQDWDWGAEEHAVTGMCYDWINKNPELHILLPDNLRDKWVADAAAGKRPEIIFSKGRIGWHVRGYSASHESSAHATAGDAQAGPGPSAPKPTWPTPYSGRAPSQIPRRKFLMGSHLQRGKVTMTAGAGGIGKSNLGLIDAISAGIGRDLLTGEVLKQRYRVWVWNAEDDIDEVERRVCGICEYYNINRDDLVGWLFLDDAETCPIEFATAPSGRLTIEEAAVKRVADRVQSLQIDIVMFDPLIGIHTAPENDNASLGKIMRTLQNRIAKPCNCAVDVSHHVRKSSRESDGSVTADDVRGAGAIVTSVRSLRVLVPMSKDEAEKYSIGPDERLRFFRIERGKANYARRGTLHWVELVERPIPNGENGTYGDTVTICVKWAPPDATAGVTHTVAAAIRDEIGKAEWKRERRAGASWAGNIIGLRLGLDMSLKPQRDKAESILAWLIQKGVLATEYRKDKNRVTREYVVPGLNSHPA